MMRHLFGLLLLAALSASAATAGWELPTREIDGLPDAVKAWFAPIGEGADSFEVRRMGGAEGEVSFKGDAIRITKTNDKGAIWVTARTPVAPLPGTPKDGRWRLRASAEVEASSDNPRIARAFVRAGRRVADGTIPYNPYANLNVLDGKTKMEAVVVTAEGRAQLKAVQFYVSEGGGDGVFAAVCAEGGPSVTIWRNIRVDAMEEVERADSLARRGRQARDFSSGIADPEAFNAMLAKDFEHTGRVEKGPDGYARLLVDGKPIPPILFKGGHVSPPDYQFGGRRMHEVGVPLLVSEIRLGTSANRLHYWTTNGFDAAGAATEVRRSMLAAPSALYVLTVKLDAPAGWCLLHTNEIWRTENGDPCYGHGGHLIGTKPPEGQVTWPWPSYHSKVLQEETKRVLTEFIAELKRTGISKRIVGIHLGGYHDAQFATARPDWSEPARRAFAESGESDYAAFLKRRPMELQDDYARLIRREIGKPIAVFRWCMSAFGLGFCSSHDIREFADSKEIDAIVPQVSYSWRSPGYAVGVKMPFSSLHLNGKLLVTEHDLRTYASWPSEENIMRRAGLSRAEDIDEWRTINRKTAGQMIARRTGFWYFDMEKGWFDDSEIAADIGDVVRQSREIYIGKADPWRPTAAFIIDEADLLALQRASGQCEQPKADINRYIEEIAASGVPFDVYMKGDIDRYPEVAARYAYRLDYNRATPLKTAMVLNAEARASGAYVPLPPGVVQVDMNGDFVSLHCLVPGHYDFLLPRECEVVNMKSGLTEPTNDRILPVEMTAGETCWFRLKSGILP